jgi:hypothetical protein
VDGKGGRLPIVWDESSADYKFRHPSKVNPRFLQEHGSSIDEEFNFRTPVLTFHGSLDLVLTMSQPVAKGDSDEWPELSAAPTATKMERQLLGV